MSGKSLCLHQFHPSVARGDAITQQMFFFQSAMERAGLSGRIFAAENRDELLGVLPWNRSELWDCDALWVHHSTGHATVPAILNGKHPKALVYHNITPAQFFRHDPYLAYHSRLGRKQLAQFRRSVNLAFTFSNFNARELREEGFTSINRLPLFDWQELQPKEPPKKAEGARPLTLLFVGRLTPHKDQAFLIEMFFHFLREYPKARLNLVGKADPVYGHYVKGLRDRLGLREQVKIPGRLSSEALSQCYQEADAFVCASHHEGYCVPLVEAMKADLPIFAAPCEGVEETLGIAGIQQIKRDPKLFAEVVSVVLKDTVAKGTLLEHQRKRFEKIKEEQNIGSAQKAVVDFLKQLEKTRPDHSLITAKEKGCTEINF